MYYSISAMSSCIENIFTKYQTGHAGHSLIMVFIFPSFRRTDAVSYGFQKVKISKAKVFLLA